MVRLFEDACRHLLAIAPAEREAWLLAPSRASAPAVEILMPVVVKYAGVERVDLDAALAWCRHYIVGRALGSNADGPALPIEG